MKIVQVHNFYKIRAGEATVVQLEKTALQKSGIEVVTYYRDNKEIETFSTLQKLSLIHQTTWSKKTIDEFRAFLKKEQPDLCHVHNILPLISPSIFEACVLENIPVVQTLHNYRLICTNGLLMRKGKICELCLGKSAYQSINKKCYRDSKAQTYAVARMLEKNKKNKTWTDKVDAYLCLTEFAKAKFIAHGIPAEKLIVKPNMAPIPEGITSEKTASYFLFVGRLTESKGVRILSEIATKINLPIKVVGEGDLAHELEADNNLQVLGKLPYQQTLSLIKNAKALIFPSLWYEGMPLTILEAFALKTPVIASNLGAMKSLIQHKKNGLLFEPGSVTELVDNLNFVCSNADNANQMVDNAFKAYETHFSVDANVKALLTLYSNIIASRKK